MKTFLFLFLVGVGHACFTQPTTFNEKHSFNYPAVIIQGIVGNGDSIIFSGFVGDSFPPYPERSFIGVANQHGDIQYFHILDTTNKDYWIYPASLTKSKHGDYYFTSGIWFDKYTANLGYTRAFIWKLDSNLDTVFTRHYAPPTLTDGLVMDNHVEYNKDTLFLLCTVDKYNSQGNFYDDDLVIILTDSLGNEYKRTHFIDNSYRHIGWAAERCKAGIITSSVKRKRFNDNGVWKQAVHPNVLVFDNQGNIIKSYNALSTDYRNSLWATATEDNNYIFCGSKVYNVLDPMGTPNVAQQLSKGYIEKLDSNFQKVWGLEFGRDSNYYSAFTKIIEAKNGDYIAIGRNFSMYETAGVDTTVVDSVSVVGWAVRVAPSGNTIWERNYRVVYGHWSRNYLGDIYEQHDGSLVMCGYVYDDSPSPITNYGWLLKTDSMGCLVPGCQNVGIISSQNLSDHIKLYPNPVQSELYLYYNNPTQPYAATFRVWDIQGQEIVAPNALASGTTYILPVRGWAQGIYFLQVQDEKGNVHVEKFIKE